MPPARRRAPRLAAVITTVGLVMVGLPAVSGCAGVIACSQTASTPSGITIKRGHVIATLAVRFAATAVPLRNAIEQFLPKMREVAGKIEHDFSN